MSALLIVVVGRPAIAEACSGPAHGLTVLAPADEATGVPLNVAPTLTYTNPNSPGGFDNLELRANDGTLVPTTIVVEPWAGHDWLYRVIVQPGEPLLPGNRYRLRLAGAGGGIILSSFTTGTETDAMPPTPPALGVIETNHQSDYETSCGDYSVVEVDIRVTSDEPVTYMVRQNGRLLAEQGPLPSCPECDSVLGYIVCDGRKWSDSQRWELPPGTHTLEISARDLAGNESAPTEVTISADCPGGCSASGAAGGAGWFVPALLVVVVARRRRLHRMS